jgi:hypothetical protein
MGEAYRGLDRIAEALDCHQRCLELLAHSEDAIARPRALQRLGHTLLAAGRRTEGRQALNAARQQLTELGVPASTQRLRG